MRIHSLQHVPFEDLANIEWWAKEKGHGVSRTLLFKAEPLPSLAQLDWLIILGGPMNIYEEDKYPWLAQEKKFIAQAIVQKKIVLGICLGAQLIADVLGGKVYKNKHKEIGWFPVSLTPECPQSCFFKFWPQRFMAFHWHGDTFEIPPGALRIAESEGCASQAFEYRDRVVGMQFHLESSLSSIQRLIENCGDEIVEGPYIQRPENMLDQSGNLSEIKRMMEFLLDRMEKRE